MDAARAASPYTSTTPSRVETLEAFGLGGVDCPMCNNTGYLVRRGPDGAVLSKPCACMGTRRSLRRIRESGLADALSEKTLASFQTPDACRRLLKEKALEYVDTPGAWWLIGGRSGSGKTHLCTAICGELIGKGEDVRYCVWTDFSKQAKAALKDREAYAELVEPLKRVRVLYVDDFFKVQDGPGQLDRVTAGDVNLAFEIINARYLDRKKRTILSTEFSAEELLQIDEALGGRIYERSRGFCLSAPAENWRLRA